MSDESLHDSAGSHESTSDSSPAEHVDPPVTAMEDDHLAPHPSKNNAPEAAEGGSPPTDRTAEHEPAEGTEKTPVLKTPVLTWFRCRTTTHIGSLNILAKDAHDARERFKKALGIRSTPHDITITELLPDFTPSEKDKELESLIDKNGSPPN